VKIDRLYDEYLHNIIIPLSQIRSICKKCEKYHLCKLSTKIDVLIDKSFILVSQMSTVKRRYYMLVFIIGAIIGAAAVYILVDQGIIRMKK
jgi:hypothetical protein